ncbi:MAG TPA: hypothetical protein VGX95_09750 [Xanthobacteraceae bacterium]|jgi:hypothetical protein|nr:hypothetical protein [Xanthobacteraceae bacterium]
MRAHRAWPINYLACGFAISIALAAATGEARAQVDPNLQTTINVFSPPITAVEIAPQTAPAPYSVTDKETGDTKCATRPEALDYAKKHPQLVRWLNKLRILKNMRNRAQDKALLAEMCLDNVECAKRLGISQPISNWACTRQPTTLKFTLVSNPTYETNVLKSNQNIHSDTSLGFGGTVLSTIAGLRDYDIIAFSAGTASARYSAFPSKSLDNVSVQGLYQFFLDAQTVDGNPINHPPKADVNTSKITYDVLAIGFVNQTSLAPTFRTEMADLFTPQVTLARQNIGLSDLGPANTGCTPLFNAKPLQPGYCYYANISVTAGQTFSDVPTLQNANVALAGTVSTRFDHTDWVLSLAGTATAKNFENVPRGRQDLLLQVGPQLAYTPSKCLSFSVSATYYRNYSSLTTAAWNGLIVQPTLTVNFGVDPPPDTATGHTICG